MLFRFIDVIFVFILPVFFLLMGILTLNRKTIKINSFFGYRTPRSMRCIRSWNWAQQMLGEYLLYDGLFFLVFSSLCIVSAAVIKKELLHSLLPSVLILVQTLSLLYIILKIEKKLKKEHKRWDEK